jgi:hypothetical protein
MIERIEGRISVAGVSKARVSRRAVIGGMLAAGVSASSPHAADLSPNYRRRIKTLALTPQQVVSNAANAFSCQNHLELNQYLDQSALVVRKISGAWQGQGPPSLAVLNQAMNHPPGAKFVITSLQESPDPTNPNIALVTGSAIWQDWNPSPRDGLSFLFKVLNSKIIYMEASGLPTSDPLPPITCT